MPSALLASALGSFDARRLRSLCVLFLAGASGLLFGPGMAAAQPFEFTQEYFVPVSSESLRAFAQSINTQGLGNTGGTAPDDVKEIISLTALRQATIVVVDHWEDGLEPDLTNPPIGNIVVRNGTLARADDTGGSTEIFGDGNWDNGAPPSCTVPGAPGDACDVINEDTFIVLDNVIAGENALGLIPANPRNPANIFYDGNDRVGVTEVMAMTKAGWRSQESTLLAGAVEVFPTYLWGSEFELPAGQNHNAGCDPLLPDTDPQLDLADVCMFEYTSASVTATEVGATISVDYDGDGTGDLALTLGPGESTLLANLLVGTEITSTDPVEVHVLTGDVGSNYESRWFTLVPLSQWSDTYYSPVGSTSASQPAYVLLYNPSDSAITVDASTRTITASGGETTFNSAPATLQVNDGGGAPFGPVTVSFTVSGIGDVGDLDLGVAIDTQDRDDFDIILMSPTGTRVRLSDISSAIGFLDWYLVFDDEAGGSFEDGNDDVIPGTIDFSTARTGIPAAPLSLFDGEPADGTWTLEFYDPFNNNVVSTLLAAQLQVTGQGTDTISSAAVLVPANGLAEFLMPIGSGARFENTGGEPYFAFSTIDFDNTSTDWGMTLLPEQQLTTAVVTGWAPGRNPDAAANLNENGSPVWVTAAADAVLSIFFDGDTTGPPDATVQIDELQSLRIFDPDGDQSGLVIQSDGALITAAWGQDVANASPGGPAIDVGTTVVPIPVLDIAKDVALLVDVNGDGDPDGGDTLLYTITVRNVGTTPATNVQLEDPVVDPATAYVLGSTSVDGVPFPDDGGGTPFPLDGGGINLGTLTTSSERIITFEVTINNPDTGVLEILNTAVVTSPNGGGVASSVVPVPTPEIALTKTSDVVGFAEPGDIVSYTITLTNTGLTDQIGISIGDVLPAGTSYVPGSTVVNGFGLDIFRAADEFRSVAYNLNDGPDNWTGNWTEINDDGTVGTGNVRVAGGELRIDNQDGGSLEGVQRNADLSAFSSGTTDTTATLSLIYRTGEQMEAGDRAIVEVLEGGTVCTSQSYGGNVGDIPIAPGPSSSYVTLAFDDQTACGELGLLTVRVRILAGFQATDGAGEFFSIDNVQLAVTESAGSTANNGGAGTQLTDGAPPNLVLTPDLFGLPPGQSMTVTFQVQVDDPLVPFRPSIVNTATATTLDNPFPLFATVVDPVAEGGAVGDRVWLDVDGDGIDDVGEPGIANVEVELFDLGADGLPGGIGANADTSLGTILTDTNGNYLFDNLLPGSYHVVVNTGVPSGLELSPGGSDPSAVRTIVNGEEFFDLDFGYRNLAPNTAIIGDLVWADGNNNGVREINEPGIGGVTVVLIDLGADGIAGTPDDSVVGSPQTTAVDGTYFFIGVPVGSYVVQVTDTGNVLDTLTITTGPQAQPTPSIPIAVAVDDVYLEADFGFFGENLHTISDTVWIDDNNDMLLNVGSEQGVLGVTVALVDPGPDMMFGGSDDVVVATATSDENGEFSFVGVADGNYQIQITDNFNALRGFGPTTTAASAGLLPVTVAGADITNISFGYNAAGTIGDTVWSDADGDAVRDPGEAGIENIDVQLFRDNNSDGLLDVGDTQVGATVQTDAFGNYRFVGLEPADYIVHIPSGQAELAAYENVTTPDEDGGTAGEQRVSNLGPGESDLTRDFGYQDTSGDLYDISGTVFNDTDRDGLEESGEPGIADVKLVLLNSAGDMIAMTRTDSNGDYVFPDLPDLLTYTILVVPAQSPVLTNFQLTSGIDTIDVTLAGADVADVNFGYARDTPTGSIGDLVYNDANRDGVFNGSEAGLPGITVELWDAGLDGIANTADDVFQGTTDTDADGRYLFDNLTAGNYFVRVRDSFDIGSGNGDANGNPMDENGNPGPLAGFERTDTGGLGADSFVVGLSEGENYEDADFGFAVDSGPPSLLGSIGDEVYLDANKDGDRDAGEPGIDGVRVDLFRTTDGTIGNGDDVYVGSTVTVGGLYSFSDLPPGNYFVQVADAVGGGNGDGVGNAGTPLDGLQRRVPLSTDSTSAVSTLIALADNETYVDADFGYAPATGFEVLGDTVYYDADGDGGQDPGELGLPSVRVIITPVGGVFGCANDSICLDTDAMGNYLQTVATGDYNVAVCTGSAAPDPTCVAANSVPSGLTTPTQVPPATVTVPVGGNLDADFGFDGAGLATIGDTVYRDLDASGTQNGVEAGIAGVDVRLVNVDTGATVATLTTGASGDYRFEGVDPNTNYRVEVIGSTLPPLLFGTQSDGVVPASSLTAGSDHNDADFGFAPSTSNGPGTIGDTVFLDVDGNGAQDVGEPGIGGVVVELFDAGADGAVGGGDDTSVATTTTQPNGYYEFPNVPAGTYFVHVVDADTVPGTGDTGTTLEDLERTDTPASADSSIIFLAGAETYVDADFGFDSSAVGSGLLGDTVYFDANGDSNQDPGELGLPGVRVIITLDGDSFGCSNQSLCIETDGAGNYLEALPAGNYNVVVCTAAATPDPSCTAGNSVPAAMSVSTEAPAALVAVPSGGAFLDADFGFDEVGDNFITIGDTVYNDDNGNGQQDVGESGIGGVTIALVDITVPSSPVVIGLTTTDGAGAYSFAGVPVFVGPLTGASIYRVDITDENNVVANLTQTQAGRPAGEFPLIAGAGEILDNELDDPLADYLDADFGYATLQELGDTVFFDVIDENGAASPDGFQQDSELGIPGVRVIVTPLGVGTPNCSGASICPVTDSQGRWRAVLPSGQYSVLVCTQPSASIECNVGNSIPSTLNQTTTSFSGSNPQVFTVTSGGSVLYADYGFQEDSGTYATIGDTVYLDLDGDGAQQVGETGLENVTLSLVTGGAVVATATTGVDGSYRFYGVDPDLSYEVVVTDDNNILDQLNSTQNDGVVPAVSLTAGADYDLADFGYSPSIGAVGNKVWRDLSSQPIEGFFEQAEPGIEGVTLELWVDNNSNGTVEPGTDNLVRDRDTGGLTNVLGDYFFTGLSLGIEYLVVLTDDFGVLAGMVPSVCTDFPPCVAIRGTPAGVDNQSKSSPYAVTLTMTLTEDFSADFGFVPAVTNTLSGLVYADNNNDADYQSASDAGTEGVGITLFRVVNGLRYVYGSATTTATMNSGGADFNYLFADLPAGDWVVQVDNTGTFLSGANQTEPATGAGQPAAERTASTTGGDATEVDFGFHRPPTLVVITDTRSVLENGVVHFEFETSSEIGSLGFYLWRLDGASGEYVQVNSEMVVAESAPQGGIYRVADPGAEAGTLQYVIYEVEARGGERVYGPLSVVTERASGLVVQREFSRVTDQYRSASRPQSALDRERFSRARMEQGARAQADELVSVASELRTHRKNPAQVRTYQGGMQRLSVAAIASATGFNPHLVQAWIATGNWRLTRGQRLVAWEAAPDNGSMVFYAPAPTSLYSEFIAYELTRGRGTVMDTRDGGAPAITSTVVADLQHFEEQSFPRGSFVYEAERDFWFWKGIFGGTSVDRAEIELDLPTLQAADGSVEILFYGLSGGGVVIDHRVEIALNAVDPLNPTAQELLCLDGSCVIEWSGHGEYRVVLPISADRFVAGANLLTIEALPLSTPGATGATVDWIKVRYAKSLDALDGSVSFIADTDPSSTVTGFLPGDQIAVYELGATTRRVINTSRSGGSEAFTTTAGRRYIAVSDTAYQSPTVAPWPVATSFDQGAEYVVIAPAQLRGPADRLAQYRSADYSTLVFDVETVFNEFAFGDRDPGAIRDFLADAWANWIVKPRFVTILGKGTYDYRDVRGRGGNLVPPVLVATPVGLFASDAHLANVEGDSAPEFAIGRIPAITIAEADAYIDKLIAYETAGLEATNANSDVVLLSDNSDSAGNFTQTNNRVGIWVSQLQKTRMTVGEVPTATLRANLQDTLNDGAYWLNFVGHGGLQALAHEQVLTATDVANLQSGVRLPIVTGLSCSIGRFEFPGFSSLSETLILTPEKGAIAVWAPSGVSYDQTADRLGTELFKRSFGPNREPTLGEAVMEASRAYRALGLPDYAADFYNLIGDPALKLISP